MTNIHENQVTPAFANLGYIPNKASQTLPLTTQNTSSKQLIELSYSRLLLLFVIGSIAGLVIEIIYHFIVYGEYQSRVGLIWGPFSPLYGFGAIALTITLNRLWQLSNPSLFGASMVIGSIVEFIASWGMEYFFGAVAWDYSGTFMNIQGRVNLTFALMWGMLGLVWVRAVMPRMNVGFNSINWKSSAIKAGSIAMTIFLAVNIVMTLQALNRESERAIGLPAATQVDYFFDEYFPTEIMEAKFENMSIYGLADN